MPEGFRVTKLWSRSARKQHQWRNIRYSLFFFCKNLCARKNLVIKLHQKRKTRVKRYISAAFEKKIFYPWVLDILHFDWLAGWGEETQNFGLRGKGVQVSSFLMDANDENPWWRDMGYPTAVHIVYLYRRKSIWSQLHMNLRFYSFNPYKVLQYWFWSP